MKRSCHNLLLAIVVSGSLACSSTDAGTNPGTGGNAGTGGSAGTGGDAGTGGNAGTGGDVGTGGAAGQSEWRIFRTETVSDANLGGIAGADAICAAQALEAGLEGDFRAWLSPIGSPVADRLTQAGGPYALVDGTRVADDWDDLVDGSILAPINLDASGVERSGEVWTGTLADGTSYLIDDCGGFTNGLTGVALCGASASTTSTWTDNITPACSTRLGLYCIEQ